MNFLFFFQTVVYLTVFVMGHINLKIALSASEL